MLVDLAEAPEPPVSEAAIAALASIATPSAIALLERIAAEGSPGAQAAALAALPITSDERLATLGARLEGRLETDHAWPIVDALVASGRPEAIDVLARCAETRRALVGACAGGLGEIDDPRAREALARIAGSHDERIAFAALRALAETEDADAIARIVDAARVGSPRRRTAAVFALEAAGGESADAALLELAQGDASDMRIPALAALVSRGDREAIEATIDALEDGPSHPDCQTLIVALGTSRAPEARTALLTLARGRAGPVRSLAIHALVEAGSIEGEVLDVLIDAARGGGPEGRSAILGLARSADPSGGEALRELALGSSGSARWAVHALTELGGERETLLAIARDPRSPNRSIALGALADLPGPGTREVLLAASRSAEPGAQDEALRALADIDGDAFDQRLEELATDPDPGIRLRALQLGMNVESDAAVATVRAGLEDPEPSVRRAAVFALSGSRARDALEGLLSRATDADSSVRSTVLHAIAERGEGGDPRATRAILDALDDPELFDAAARAALQSAEGVEALLARLEESGPEGSSYLIETMLESAYVEPAQRARLEALVVDEAR
jgi:HEAT repeat protein